MSRSHTVCPWGRHSKLGHLYRNEAEPWVIEEDGIFFVSAARDKVRMRAAEIIDWDVGSWRGRRSAGWKNRKNRRQWEHNLIEREKHEKNRLLKEKKSHRFETNPAGDSADL